MKRNEMIEKIFIARGEELYLGKPNGELLKEEEKAFQAFMDEIRKNEKLKELYDAMHFAESAVWSEACNRFFCEGVRYGSRLMMDVLFEKN